MDAYVYRFFWKSGVKVIQIKTSSIVKYRGKYMCECNVMGCAGLMEINKFQLYSDCMQFVTLERSPLTVERITKLYTEMRKHFSTQFDWR